MSFLAPLFLAGALVVGLPILFHLIRRSTRERTVFSTLMFLHPSPPQLSRRSRLEHILLLLLRCAAVILLALGFARPFIKHIYPAISASGPTKRTVVLLDTSASMRRQNLWAAAKERAEAALRQAGPFDQVALFAFDRQLKPLLTFEEWNATPTGDRLALARSRLSTVQPGWSGTHLDTALIRAAEMLFEGEEASFAGPRQVVVISDFQEGTEIRALQGHEWPKNAAVIAEPIKAPSGNNAAIQLVTESTDKRYVEESIVRVRISNAPDSKREQFQVGWAGADGKYAMKPSEVYVPAGQSRIVALTAAQTNAFDRIVLSGDDDPFDNTVFVVPAHRTQVTVVYFGSDTPQDTRQPLFFLNRALQETRSQQVRIVAHRPSTPATAAEMDHATLLVVTDPVSESDATALHEAVRRGKTILFAPTSTAAASTWSTILGTQVHLTEKAPGNYAMLGQIDFRHPLFAPFADPRFSDFSKLHFWKYRAAEVDALSGARIVARFDTGDPAMLEMPLGKGRLIFWAACWHPTDSQLAVSSKFVPLLYSLLEYGGAASPTPQQYFVDAAVPLSTEAAKGGPGLRVRLPDGEEMPLRTEETNFLATATPGIYLLNGTLSPIRFAVNLEPSESRTAPMAIDELERLGVPTGRSAPVALTETKRKTRLQNSEMEARQKLWRWFIVATLAVLGLETWLAGRTARRALAREPEAETAASPVIQEENA